jgi:protein TonB
MVLPMRIRSIPFLISAFIHLTVIGAATIFLVRPPEFAMDAGRSSVEVNLVAAAPDPVPTPPPTPVPEDPVETAPPKPDDVIVPVTTPVPPTLVPPPEQQKVETPPPPAPVPPKPHRTPTVAKGDGSAPKPGRDAITASSDGGAIMDAKPDYLSNPPPEYPPTSIHLGQEGVVTLEVIVSEDGRPDDITIRGSSGFGTLDQSAVTAVRKWRFKPAELGSMKVKSRVVIPVRFHLAK